MNGQERIETLFAFIVVDTDGTEGIPVFQSGQHLIPLTGADVDRVLSLMPIAMQIAGEHNRSIEVVHFSRREHQGWVDPPGGPQRPPETPEREVGPFVAPHVSLPYTNFPAPEPAPEDVVHAEGVWVAGTMVDGKAGVAIRFCVNGEWLPAFVVAGRVAEDMCILDSDALEAVRRTQN